MRALVLPSRNADDDVLVAWKRGDEKDTAQPAD